MGLRSGWLAIALACACTGANPAFDQDGSGTKDAGDAEATTDLPQTSEGEDATATLDASTGDASTTAEPTTSDMGGQICSIAEPFEVGTATSREATRCPSDGFIRGTVSAVEPASLTVTDCGSCDFCSREAPQWTVTLTRPLLAEMVTVGECVDVFFDCDQGAFTELQNLVVAQGPDAPFLLIGAPNVPLSLGGWGPTVVPGAACATEACPGNTELALQFEDTLFAEGEGGTVSFETDRSSIVLDVLVENAHNDPTTCERRLAWLGRPG